MGDSTATGKHRTTGLGFGTVEQRQQEQERDRQRRREAECKPGAGGISPTRPPSLSCSSWWWRLGMRGHTHIQRSGTGMRTPTNPNAPVGSPCRHPPPCPRGSPPVHRCDDAHTSLTHCAGRFNCVNDAVTQAHIDARARTRVDICMGTAKPTRTFFFRANLVTNHDIWRLIFDCLLLNDTHTVPSETLSALGPAS